MSINFEFEDFKSLVFSIDGIDNNRPHFTCIVTYQSKFGNLTENTSARMLVTTMEYGNINLEETDSLTAEKYHLDFNPKWQNYSFNGEGLEISGKSGKMGTYKVTIVPKTVANY